MPEILEVDKGWKKWFPWQLKSLGIGISLGLLGMGE